MSTTMIVIMLIFGAWWFSVLLVFIASELEVPRETWNTFFIDNGRWNWAVLSPEERTFIVITMWIVSPILYPAMLGFALGIMFWRALKGFKQIIFRIRSRHFDKLRDKITTEVK